MIRGAFFSLRTRRPELYKRSESREVLSVQAELIAGMSRHRIMREALAGRVRTRVVGNRLFFNRADLEKLHEEGRETAGAA